MLLVVVGVVLYWPVLATVLASFRGDDRESRSAPIAAPTRDFGGEDLARPLRLAGETLRLVFATEALALPLGIALAVALFRCDTMGRRVAIGLLAIVALVPMPLHATAWLGAFGNVGRTQIFGRAPILLGWTGAAVVHALAALPWVVLIVGVGLQAVESELEDSALLDLPTWRVALQITLRRALGAIGAAALATAVLTAGDMTVTDLLQVRTYAEEAYFQYGQGKGPSAAGVVTIPPLIVIGAAIVAGALMLRRVDPARIASATVRARLWSLGRWHGPVAAGVWTLLLAYVGLPISSLVWRTGRVGGAAAAGIPPHWTLHGFIGSLSRAWGETWELTLQSALIAAAAALLSVALAAGLAWASRASGRWRLFVLFTLALTLAMPGPVAGMGLFLGYLTVPVIFDTPAILVLGASLRTLPYALLILWPAFLAIAPEYFEAAELDGIGPWGQAWKIGFPLSVPALFAAWCVTFVLGLGEVPATNLVLPPGYDTITVKIWRLLHTGVDSRLAGVVLVMLATVAIASGLALAAVCALARRLDESEKTPSTRVDQIG